MVGASLELLSLEEIFEIVQENILLSTPIRVYFKSVEKLISDLEMQPFGLLFGVTKVLEHYLWALPSFYLVFSTTVY
jgi:hypothetical protein